MRAVVHMHFMVSQHSLHTCVLAIHAGHPDSNFYEDVLVLVLDSKTTGGVAEKAQLCEPLTLMSLNGRYYSAAHASASWNASALHCMQVHEQACWVQG